MQNTAKRVDYIMKPYPAPHLSNGWSGNGVPIEKGHIMGNKKQTKMGKAIKRIERMLDQQSRLIDIALSGGEDTFVVESTLAENSGGNGFVISEDRQTINYLGENYYSARAWVDRGDDSLPDTVMEDEAWARAKLAELDAACLKAAIALNEFSHRNMGKDEDGVKATYEGVPLTAEQAAQLDSGSGTEDTAGWLAGQIVDGLEKDEAVRKHRKRMEKVNVQRKIKDEPQA